MFSEDGYSDQAEGLIEILVHEAARCDKTQMNTQKQPHGEHHIVKVLYKADDVRKGASSIALGD